MLAKLVTITGEQIAEERYDYLHQMIKMPIIKTAKYSARHGLACRIEVYRDNGDLVGYYAPGKGYQHIEHYHGEIIPDWWEVTVKPPRRAVGRPRGEPKPPKQRKEPKQPKPPKGPRVRLHPINSHPYPSIYLTEDQATYARTIGNGNLSAGIRSALDAHKMDAPCTIQK